MNISAVSVLCFQWFQHPFQLPACQVRILVSGPICWQCLSTKHAQQGYLRTKLRYGGYISFRPWAHFENLHNFGDYSRRLISSLGGLFCSIMPTFSFCLFCPSPSIPLKPAKWSKFWLLYEANFRRQPGCQQCWLYSSPIILARCFVTQCYTELNNVTQCHTMSQSHSVLCRCTAPRP